MDLEPFSLFLLLVDLCKYLLSLEFDLLTLGRFCIDSALNDSPARPTEISYFKQTQCGNKKQNIPIVPDDDLLSNALVSAETSAPLMGMSRDPPQLAHSTDGPRNH